MLKKNIFRCSLLIFSLLISTLVVKGANERIINSLTGQNIKTAAAGTTSISIVDPWFSTMLTTSAPFYVKNSKAKVILRYADITQHFDATNWSLKVYYKVTRTKIVGTTQTTLSPVSETLTINYDATAASYKDIDLKLYEGFCKISIEITAIDYTVNSVLTHTVPSLRDNDIFLDLELETERIYFISTTPTVYSSTINQTTDHELPIAWTYVQGAESYDVEWLLIDIGQGHLRLTIRLILEMPRE